ncbi:MAG: response regulator transcription factor [Lachnospiraceae bacterium]|nr:response regulator transcription factor [Lachnospiraceae bacterium]
MYPSFPSPVNRAETGTFIKRNLLKLPPFCTASVCGLFFPSNPAKHRNRRLSPAQKPEASLPAVPPAERNYTTASEAYEAYRRLGLTNREAELALLIEQGKSNGEIAAELNISETTVKKHISNIFDKLEVCRREQIREKLR